MRERESKCNSGYCGAGVKDPRPLHELEETQYGSYVLEFTCSGLAPCHSPFENSIETLQKESLAGGKPHAPTAHAHCAQAAIGKTVSGEVAAAKHAWPKKCDKAYKKDRAGCRVRGAHTRNWQEQPSTA